MALSLDSKHFSAHAAASLQTMEDHDRTTRPARGDSTPGHSTPAHEGFNPALAAVSRLIESRHIRRETGRFWIEGVRSLIQAEKAGFALDELLVCRRLLRSQAGKASVARLSEAGARLTHISADEFRAISTLARASGVGAVAQTRERSLPQKLGTRPSFNCQPGDVPSLWIVLEHIRSSGNLGTLIRTISAVGGGLCLLGSGIDPWEPGAVRASMGSLFHVPIVRTKHRKLARWLRKRRVRLLGADAGSGEPHFRAKLSGPVMIALGGERNGLSRRTKKLCDGTVRVPMSAKQDSLNIAVAGAVLLYESARQSCVYS